MTAGRVSVNGEVRTELGTEVDPIVDSVTVDGKPVSLAEEPVYLALNKPAGVVTTMSDPQGRTTVAALMPVRDYPGLFPVGRLDYETTGLLLFTTDGEIAHRLLHPSRHVEKVYRVLVDGRATEPELDRLREGVSLDDGLTAPARVQGAALLGRHDVLRDRHLVRAESARCAGCSRRSGTPCSSCTASASGRWIWAT